MARLVTDSGSSFRRLRDKQGRASGALSAAFRVLFYAFAVASVALLALTGFIPYLLLGESVSGVSLVLHVAVAPVFAVCMTVLTLLWAHSQRFDSEDLSRLASIARRGAGEPAGAGHSSALKLSFWAMVILAPLIMGSIMLSMYPLFSTPGQMFLLTLHLVSSLLFVVVAIAQVVILVGALDIPVNERQDPGDQAE